MTDPHIGQYVIRERDEGPRLTLAHRCESVIEDEPVTRCGRRLRHRRGTHFAYAAVPAVRICKGCD